MMDLEQQVVSLDLARQLRAAGVADAYDRARATSVLALGRPLCLDYRGEPGPHRVVARDSSDGTGDSAFWLEAVTSHGYRVFLVWWGRPRYVDLAIADHSLCSHWGALYHRRIDGSVSKGGLAELHEHTVARVLVGELPTRRYCRKCRGDDSLDETDVAS